MLNKYFDILSVKKFVDYLSKHNVTIGYSKTNYARPSSYFILDRERPKSISSILSLVLNFPRLLKTRNVEKFHLCTQPLKTHNILKLSTHILKGVIHV